MSRGRLVLVVLLLVAVGLAWWLLFLGRGDTGLATARREDPAPSVPGPELAGRVAEPVPAATPVQPVPPERAPTWRLEGRVTAGGVEGVAGATVEVVLKRGELESFLAGGVTDREGNYAQDISTARALGPFALSGAVLRVVGSADGHSPEERHVIRPWPDDLQADHLVRQDLVLPAGDVLRGRVVGPDGKPVSGADVAHCAGDRRWNEVSTLPDGRYVLAVASLAVPGLEAGWVVAHHPDLGAGRLPVGVERALPDLVLEATPTVEGAVVFADGSPVAGVLVRSDVIDTHDPCLQGGWAQPFTRTRANGTFRLLVPAEGECSLSVENGAERVPCRTGDRNVRLVLRAHVVRVRIVDDAGRGVPGLVLFGAYWGPERVARLDGFLGRGAAPDEIRRSADMTRVGRDATWTILYLGQPGGAWVFLVNVPGAAPAEALLRIPLEGNESDVRIVVRPQVGGGHLRIRVVDPDGKPVPHARVTVSTPLGAPLFSGPVTPDQVLGPFPAAGVRLAARPVAHAEHMDWVESPDIWLLPATAAAVVRDGEHVEAVLRPTWGGRVRVTLRSPAESKGKTYDVRAIPSDGSRPTFLMRQSRSGLASSAFEVDAPQLALTLLAPGTYQLEVRPAGGGFVEPLVAQGLVTVRAREVTDVALDVAAR